MGPVYLNEYQSRAEYYETWLKDNLDHAEIPENADERLQLLIAKRKEAYQKLCSIVYEKKGYTSEGVPMRETVNRFGLLDEQAKRLLSEFGV